MNGNSQTTSGSQTTSSSGTTMSTASTGTTGTTGTTSGGGAAGTTDSSTDSSWTPMFGDSTSFSPIYSTFQHSAQGSFTTPSSWNPTFTTQGTTGSTAQGSISTTQGSVSTTQSSGVKYWLGGSWDDNGTWLG